MKEHDVPRPESERNDRVRVGRRPFLWGLGAAGAAGLLGSTSVSADDGAWLEPEDSYYARLVEDLRGMGLPPAAFVHAETESGTHGEYWASTPEFEGSAEGLDVAGDGVPFSEAVRFTIDEDPENNWDAQFRTADWHSSEYRSVEVGQVLLGVAYLRAPDGAGTVQYVADNDASEEWNSVVDEYDGYQEVDSDWERYYFPIEFDADADWEEWSTQFHLGFEAQTVDIGGIALLDFGTDVDVASLPSGVGATDPYYDSLVTDLEDRGLPTPAFVYADTEAGAREAFFSEGTDETDVEDLDVGGDGVPFRQATRFEIHDAPENDWDVQLRGDVDDRAIEDGDVFLGVVYLRAPEGEMSPEFLVQAETGEFANEVANDPQPTVGEEWKRYYFRIESGKTDDPGNWWSELWFGHSAGTIDVGGLALLAFDDVDVGDLPAWEEEEDREEIEAWPEVDDPYYAELVEELSNLDIAPGRFVYAENELDTFEAYELAGAVADLAERSPLEVEAEDVPFSEATRITVGEDDDVSLDPWSVNLLGSVDDRGIGNGDVLLGVVYLKSPDEDGADVTYKTTDADNEADNYALNGSVSVDGEWTRYFFPAAFGSTGDAGEWWTELWLGVEGQTVDIGGLALLDFAQGVDANDLPTWEDDVELEEGWEEAADERITEHRTDELTVEVVDSRGFTVENADVEVAMRDHEFSFGTAVDAETLFADGEDGDRYRETIREYFNTAVLENHHKWRFFEEEQETADEATAWLLEEGLSMRGHACLWSAVDAWAVPPDVVDAMGVEWEDGGVEDPELDPEYVRERSFEHLETIVEHYADFGEYGSAIEQWDVVNEVIHEPAMIEAIDGEDVDAVEAPVLEEWYATATDVTPEGVALDVNDYNVLVGPYEGTRDSYERQIEFLTDAEDVDLGGVGMQCHFSRSEQLTPGELLEALDRYGAHGVDLRLTEFDMSDSNWLETDKAEFFHWFLKTVFSHEDVTDFLMWGFWDDDHWLDDAPLFYGDWERKPAYDVYTNLVFEEWWTDESGRTDDDGQFVVDGFKGEYELTARYDGVTESATATLTDGGETVEIELDVRVDPDKPGKPDDPGRPENPGRPDEPGNSGNAGRPQ